MFFRGGELDRVMTQAMWSYFTRQRSSQLIVEPRRGEEPAPSQTELSALPGSPFEPTSAFK